MQAESRWIPPIGPLGRLTAHARERADALASRLPELKARAVDAPSPPPFAATIRDGRVVALIAELKRRSPSKGVLNETLAADARARLYVDAGARALSVLTEPSEFGGSSEDLSAARTAVSVPLIRKDFNVHAVQVWEGRVLGAAAILLIARALGPGELERLVDECALAGVESLVEVRSEAELARALSVGAQVIGVNARDLETLVIEPEVTARLLPAIPASCVRVAESGVSTVGDVERAASLGADAVLVGSSLSSASDAASLARALSGVARAHTR